MNRLYLVSGPSGSGKTSVMRKVMQNEILSFTTRPMRVGEIDGIDYIFTAKEHIEHLLQTNGLIEHTTYDGNHYGITKEELENKLSQGDAFAIVDANGFRQLKKIYPNCTSIFIYGYLDDIEIQLLQRGDDEGKIKMRLSTYEEELRNRIEYDFVILNKNGYFEQTTSIVKAVISADI